MSEDVTAVSMQVSEKAAEAALSAFKSVLDSVGRLFRELLGMEHDRARAKAQMKASKGGSQAPEKTKPPNVSATNLTGIKPGEVSLKDLAENARNTGEALSVAQNGFSQEDRKAIASAAKKYGIPVAFSNTKGKNNLYANVRSGDLPIFKQICTECVKEKIAAQPETLGNFKVQPWEVPHLTAMLKAHDLPAVFVETKSGDQYCLHDVKHQDAVRIVREEFVAKCKEIEKQFSFDKDENGFYTLKDLHSGREISFDEIPDKAAVSQQIQTQFGYDPVKADLAASKFGQEALKGKQKERYFSGSAQNEFSRIESNATLEGESLFAKPFGCWYVQPKRDEKPRVVFRDQSGKYAVLEPQNMTRAKMRSLLTEQLGITDRRTLDALTDKADRVTDFYARIVKDLLAGSTDKSAYIINCAVILALWLGHALFHALSTANSHLATFHTLAVIRKKALDKLAKMPLGNVISQPSGALKSTIVERIDSIETTLAHILPEFTTGIGAPVIILLYTFVISWKLGLAALITVPLGVICYMLMMFGYEENYSRTVRATKALNAVTTEYINGIEVIKVFGKAQSSYEKFAAAAKESAASFVDWMRKCNVYMTFAMRRKRLAAMTLSCSFPTGTIPSSARAAQVFRAARSSVFPFYCAEIYHRALNCKICQIINLL